MTLRHVNDDSMSIIRKRYGRGYRYYQSSGDPLTDKSVLKRLKKLIIPPMWSEVQICKWEDGHIQATGRDLKYRKQYIYHSEWERQRQEEKFAKMKAFGEKLYNIRKVTSDHLEIKGWTKKKVLALVVSILDETGIRIGNRHYADTNGTYGLTTLRRKHMSLTQDRLQLEYKGKSNQIRHVEIDDQEAIRMIKKSAEMPGYELFRYQDGGGQWQNVDSEEVNDYIREIMGGEFSSKDFRTWVASRIAVEMYPEAIKVKEEAPRRKFSNILLRLVADELGNTPTVCKSYYVHPKILHLIENQKLTIVPEAEGVTLSTIQLTPSELVVMEAIG